ncbi:hypothetical protein [Streptomyces nanshensis]|uniref:Uncharacterized protein n=1 Tax=Streptomyces nanshensis TaxID=518642 RepID=A0A1E7KZ93_9ACTN|nr:hypothetical protein [Streptomyces nanshensis]OEV09242.1 hypothetical protein AN218_22505 [Streptomyces nanshensis]
MSLLSPTGAKILNANDNGVVSGHPAAMAKLEADGLVIPHRRDGGTHWMTEGGWSALAQWRQDNPSASSVPELAGIPPKLPKKQHEAMQTAAGRPDQRVPGIDDRDVYFSGGTWFRRQTLHALWEAGYADYRRCPGEKPLRYDETCRSPLPAVSTPGSAAARFWTGARSCSLRAAAR